MDIYTKNRKKVEDLLNKKDVLQTKMEDIEEQIKELDNLSEKRRYSKFSYYIFHG